MPIIMAVCVVIGILIGTFYANHFSGNRLSIINSSSNKLNNLLHIIDDQYVDTVNVNDLVEKAVPQILSELDPHSVYISAKDVVDRTNTDSCELLLQPLWTLLYLTVLDRYCTVTRTSLFAYYLNVNLEVVVLHLELINRWAVK